MSQKAITESMKAHHERVFAKHGATPMGVDWGARLSDTTLRYDNMLAVLQRGDVGKRRPRLLDVGCGYGGLLERARERNIDVEYCGIDICEPMIVEAKKRFPEIDFRTGDIFETTDIGRYDYLVCNGILTQKLEATNPQMDAFVRLLVRRMFDLADEGIAFNMMSNQVNFMTDNLFYKSPVEMLSWCMTELSANALLDHAYPLYEFTMYLYKKGVPR